MKIRNAIKVAALGTAAAAIPLATAFADGLVTFGSWSVNSATGHIDVNYAGKGLTQNGDAINDHGFIQVPVKGASGKMFLTIVDDTGAEGTFSDENFVWFKEAKSGIADKMRVAQEGAKSDTAGVNTSFFDQVSLIHTGTFGAQSGINDVVMLQTLTDTTTAHGQEFTSYADISIEDVAGHGKVTKLRFDQMLDLYEGTSAGYSDFKFREVKNLLSDGTAWDPKHATNTTRNVITWAAGDELVYALIGQNIPDEAGDYTPSFSFEVLKNEDNEARSTIAEVHVHDEFTDLGEKIMFGGTSTAGGALYSASTFPDNPFEPK